jgi:uncharacterized protein (TIGR02246 family)
MKPVSADRKDFIRYPTNRVVGTIHEAAKAEAAIDALLSAGFDRKDIDILHGDGDLHRLDPTGADHGFLAQFQRTLIRSLELEEYKHLTHHVEDVRAGRFVIMVLTKRRPQRVQAADILHRHGAESVTFYGRWAYEELPPTAHASPEEIPALFARAWNEHNADALAGLFDEDAEFVDVAGLCWHDRASIRKAHAGGLEPLFNKSTIATGETRVKLLSPDVAVVHARMMVSCDPAGSVQTDPHTTIVSFVVHRVGGRWLCASAQNTDVTTAAETNVKGEPGVFGLPDYPSGTVS